MKRKIYQKLADWKENGAGKTALLIDGARRVGKSFIVEEFAKASYKTYILVDVNYPWSKANGLPASSSSLRYGRR